MKVKRSNNEVTIIRNYINSSNHIFIKLILIPLTLICNFTILIPYFIALQSSSTILIAIQALSPIISPFFMIGIVLLYWLIIVYFNRNCIFVNDKIITIYDQPIPNPFFNNKAIRINKLKQLYIKESIIKHPIFRESIKLYDLIALRKSGSRKKRLTLLTYLSKYEAFSIKQILEKKLDIEVKLLSNRINRELPSVWI